MSGFRSRQAGFRAAARVGRARRPATDVPDEWPSNAFGREQNPAYRPSGTLIFGLYFLHTCRCVNCFGTLHPSLYSTRSRSDEFNPEKMITVGSNSATGRSGGTLAALFRATRHVLTAIVLSGAVLFSVSAEAQTEIQRDVDSILSDRGYQRSLPEFAAPAIELPKVERTAGLFLTSIKPVLEFLFWMLVAVGTVFLAYALYRAVTSHLDKRAQTERLPEADTVHADRTGTSALPPGFDDIERLAAAGAFAEVVRILLLKCFQELQRSRLSSHDSALTSRELLARTALPDPEQEGLAFIVSAVELSHFGGRPISRATYERCMEGYRNIVANRPS